MQNLLCSRKAHLAAVYARAVGLLSQALGEMVARAESADFDVFWYDADCKRNAADQARMELERHIQEHGC